MMNKYKWDLKPSISNGEHELDVKLLIKLGIEVYPPYIFFNQLVKLYIMLLFLNSYFCSERW